MTGRKVAVFEVKESMKYIYAKFYLALSLFTFFNMCNLNISIQYQETKVLIGRSKDKNS